MSNPRRAQNTGRHPTRQATTRPIPAQSPHTPQTPLAADLISAEYTPPQRPRQQQQQQFSARGSDETELQHRTQASEGEDIDSEAEQEDDELEDQEEEDDDEEEAEEEDDDEEEEEEEEPLSPPSPSLREISSLASWTVSTFKTGCGVPELLSPSITQFWQSDGPQPHLLTIHFFKVVSIVRMRIYLDQELDESYTPTKMVFAAGMGVYDLVEFGEWKGEEPCGWIDVDLDGVGGRAGGRGYGRVAGENGGDDEDDVGGDAGARRDAHHQDDGKVLRCMCVQIRVLENHQNGKDTHIRGVQLFARDERLRRALGGRVVPVFAGKSEDQVKALQIAAAAGESVGKSDALSEPEWVREPELR